jgi:hypothetical protein
VISASIDADFPMIPHESALFSRGYKTLSLEVVPWQVTGKASTPQALGMCLDSYFHKGYQGERVGSKAVDFYALSCGSFRKTA